MLSTTHDQGGEDCSVTRILLLPSSSMPLSQGIDLMVGELQVYDVNTVPLHHTAEELDRITAHASDALRKGDLEGVHTFLEKAVDTMREAILILRLLCIIERNQLPGYVLDHLVQTRELIQQAMNEARSALNTTRSGHSSAA
jgi:hypothetical protein